MSGAVRHALAHLRASYALRDHPASKEGSRGRCRASRWSVIRPPESSRLSDRPTNWESEGRRAREIQKASQEPVSLETPIDEEEDSHRRFHRGLDAVVPVDAASFILLQEQLGSVLHTLEREKKVIELRFGLADGHPRTLEEVGRVRCHPGADPPDRNRRRSRSSGPSRSQRLRDYLDE